MREPNKGEQNNKEDRTTNDRGEIYKTTLIMYSTMADHPLLQSVKPDKRFFLPDGSSISSLKELARRMPTIPDAMFKSHINATKNDFYNWVSHVIRDTHLSKEMKDIKDQAKLSKLLSRRVAELEARDARREISNAVATQQTSRQKPTSWKSPTPIPPLIPPAAPPSPPAPPTFGFKPLLPPKQDRPMASLSIKKEPIEKRSGQYNRPTVSSIRKRSGSKTPSSFGFGEDDVVMPFQPSIKPIPINAANEQGEESTFQAHGDVPMPPASYYTPKESGSPSLWPSSESCDHSKHFGCMRCGMVEFGIGLTIGIVTTLMYAKAFF